jgi:hypothetical protein
VELEDAIKKDASSNDLAWNMCWQVCEEAGEQLIEYPKEQYSFETREHVKDSAKRACMCFAQQLAAWDGHRVPLVVSKLVDRVLAAAIPAEHRSMDGIERVPQQDEQKAVDFETLMEIERSET